MNSLPLAATLDRMIPWVIILFLPVFFSLAVPGWAVEIGEEELGITADFTYVSKYIWKGYDLLDDRFPGRARRSPGAPVSRRCVLRRGPRSCAGRPFAFAPASPYLMPAWDEIQFDSDATAAVTAARM